jgi:ACT domain-containing protein/aminoglycoside phosphotransferase (APT) family kinase protein
VPRDEPLPEPSTGAANAAASTALDRRVADVEPIPAGVNALYRIECADGSRWVLKAPTIAADAAFLAEPLLLERLRRETGVPVPRVRAAVPAEEGPLVVAYYVMEYLDGRQRPDVLALPPAIREQLVREAGTHLAAIQEVRLGTACGHLHAAEGELTVDSPARSWAALFEELVDELSGELLGDGPLSDRDPRFADLEPAIREALSAFRSVAPEPSPSVVVPSDYRPANLVLAGEDGADPLVSGVVDLGGYVGDGLLAAALAEEALIDTALGGTDAAESLRTAYRTAYAGARGRDRAALFDDRYPYYRLYARADRLAAFEYSSQFARERDAEQVARRWRSFVSDRLAEIREARSPPRPARLPEPGSLMPARASHDSNAPPSPAGDERGVAPMSDAAEAVNAYTVRLELVDRPGELLRALEPIADNGGNLLSIFHERGNLTPRGRIPVEVDLEATPERFDVIVDALRDEEINVIQAGADRYGEAVTLVLVGHIVETDLSNTLDRIEAATRASVTDFSLSAPAGVDDESSARVRLATQPGEADAAVAAVRDIAAAKDLRVVEPLTAGDGP